MRSIAAEIKKLALRVARPPAQRSDVELVQSLADFAGVSEATPTEQFAIKPVCIVMGQQAIAVRRVRFCIHSRRPTLLRSSCKQSIFMISMREFDQ